jgi:arylsulfatase A
MNKRWIGLTALAGAALSLTALAEQPRNVVLFLLDDLGWKDLGVYGSSYYKTTAIDRLAGEGARFTHAYAACAVCTPTRAAILTGKYPARLLMTNWTPDGRWDSTAPMREGRFLRDLPLEEVTLAEALRESGYRTASVGKWHLGGPPFSMPEHHGFDLNAGGTAHGAPGSYFFPYQGDWRIPTTPLSSRWTVFADGEPGEYLTDRLTDEAIRFIREAKDQPFFLYFPHYAPHTPIEAKPEMAEKYRQVPKSERQGDPMYAAMIESIDESVARVLATLSELGLEENTVVVITSDNGGHWKWTSAAPLRGHKGTYWEGGIRVPLIIKWPGVTEPGSVYSEPVISTDLYPTLLSAAGLPPRPNQHLDGLDLSSVLKGGSLERQALFWHFPHYNNHPQTFPAGVVRRGDWKLIESYDPAGLELYNLEMDLSEARNLVDEQPEMARSLLTELQGWRDAVDADLMKPNPDHDPHGASGHKKK